MTLERVMGQRFGTRPPIAVSNPIFVDVDGNGFQPNGDELGLPLPRTGELMCHATAATELFSGAVLVADQGQVIHQAGFGKANREWDVPNTTDTKFRLASVSKQFCSMLIMQLVEEGEVQLDDKITDYLAYYREDSGDRIVTTDGVQSAIDWFKARGKKSAWGGSLLAPATQRIKERRFDDGLRLMEFDVELTPGKAWLLRKTSQAFLDHGRPEKALTYATTGLEIKPDDEDFKNIKEEAERAASAKHAEVFRSSGSK